ncbi:MAG TPA: 3-deoxy-7-phosphoheptulonate synthase [Gemmatimonadota bacterium]|jgi:3-deoxy-7-phosphoheptulonate synthase
MILSMQAGATEEEVAHVVQRVEALGFRAHLIRGRERVVIAVLGDSRKPGMDALATAPGVDRAVAILEPYKLVSRRAHPEGSTVRLGTGIEVGGEALLVAAGPCSVESREQIREAAAAVRAAGAVALRGGAFKPRSSPYSFQGLGEAGLEMLAEAARDNGLALVTEVMSVEQIPAVAGCADVLQVGARNMQNYELLKALGRCGKPVLLKRGLSATVTELLLSAEYVVQGGNPAVILCERGIRTFETTTRNTLDLNAVAVLKEKSHLPVVVDPSHGTGVRSLVPAAAKAAIAAGADGLLIEVHPEPEAALSDGAQSLAPEEFRALMVDLEGYAALEGRRLGRAERRSGLAGADGGVNARRGNGAPPPGPAAQLRRRIEQLDAEILRLAAERTRVARVIGRRKSQAREPVRDERREAEVIAWARGAADGLGLTAETAEGLIRLLVEEAVASQTRDRAEAPAD